MASEEKPCESTHATKCHKKKVELHLLRLNVNMAPGNVHSRPEQNSTPVTLSHCTSYVLVVAQLLAWCMLGKSKLKSSRAHSDPEPQYTQISYIDSVKCFQITRRVWIHRSEVLSRQMFFFRWCIITKKLQVVIFEKWWKHFTGIRGISWCLFFLFPPKPSDAKSELDSERKLGLKPPLHSENGSIWPVTSDLISETHFMTDTLTKIKNGGYDFGKPWTERVIVS